MPSTHASLTDDDLQRALATVIDPEIRKPVTELGMVESASVDEAGRAAVTILLTVSGCPMKETLTTDTRAALLRLDGVTDVQVTLGVMSDEQRAELRTRLRGGQAEREMPFAQPGSLTRVYAVASGKGGVGKSSVTANLAASLAEDGLKVGVVDADIYGFSIPRMLGVEHRPTQVDDMILPPVSHEVKVISIGMFVPGNQPVVWRGPMLHRALQQFLSDVFWGDLDVLLLDLPPGPATSPSPSPSSSRARRSSSSRRPSRPPPRSPSGPGRSPSRPTSGSSGSSRTCRGSSSRTAPGRRSSAPAAASASPTPSPARSARTSRSSGRSRSTRPCARAPTPGCRSSSGTRRAPPRSRCAASRRASRAGRADLPDARSG